MRTLVIGDVHGCLCALDVLLEALAPSASDRIIGLGDFIDRGPDTKGVVHRLIELQKKGIFTGIMGNHEEMALQAREALKRPGELGLPQYHEWLVFGGYEAVQCYGGVRGSIKDIPEDHWEFMNSLRPYVELQQHILVHALVEPNTPMDQQTAEWLRWQRFIDPAAHFSGKIIVCGHSMGASIRNRGHAICIDTAVYQGGWLSCLELESGKIWQANQSGRLRKSMLADWDGE